MRFAPHTLLHSARRLGRTRHVERLPVAHYRTNPALYSTMIEVNRSLYMDERSGARHQGFEQLRDGLLAILQSLIEKERRACIPGGPLS